MESDIVFIFKAVLKDLGCTEYKKKLISDQVII